MEQDETGRRWLGALCLITALAAALRFYGLSRFSIWYDESTSLFSIQFVDWNFTFLRGGEMRLIPLFPIILFFWHGFVDQIPGVVMGSERSDFFLRLLPLFFGIFLVPLTFFAGRYLTGDPKAGLFASLLVAISPFHIYYAQELRPHTLYALLVLAAQLYSFRALQEDRIKLWVLAVVLSSLSFYAYYFSVFYMVSINLFVLLFLAFYRARMKRWILSQIFLGVSLIPAVWLALFVFRTYTKAQEQWFPDPNLRIVGISLKNFFAGYSPTPEVYWPLFLIAGAACLAGIFSLRSKPRIATFLVMMSVAPLLVEVVFWSTQNFAFYTHRAQLAYSPTLYILAGAGITSLRPRWLGGIAAGLIVLLTVPTLADHYAQRLHPAWDHRSGARYKVDSRSAAAYIAERLREGDFVAHSSSFTLGPFRYHYLDAPQSYVGFTDEEVQGHLKGFPDLKTWESVGFLPVRIEDVSDPAKRVWYVQSWWEPEDPAPLVHELRAWYDAHGVRIDRREFDGLTVFLFDLNPALRANTRAAWVADFGISEVPLYDFSISTLEEDLQATWRDSFARSYPRVSSPDPFGLDVWFDDVAASEAGSFPFNAKGPYSVPIRIANRSTLDRGISVQAYKAEKVIRALSFERETGSNVWRPVRSHYGKMAIRARLSKEIPRGLLTKTVALRPGRYGLFVQMYQDGSLRNDTYGDLRVHAVGAHGERIAVGEAQGHVAGGNTGWSWVYVGEVESHGAPVALELVAENVDNLPYAEVNVDRLMFVDASAANEPGPRPFWTHDLTLEPLEEKVIEIEGIYQEGRSNAVYIEFLDGEHQIFRNLSVDAEFQVPETSLP